MNNSQLDHQIIPYALRKDNYQPNLITNTRRDYSLNDQRLFCFIVNQFNHSEEYHLNQNLKFRIPIVEVSKVIDYKELRGVCDKFQDKFVYKKDEKNSFEKMYIFPRLKYNSKEGMIDITMFSEAIPFFVNLGKEYTRYNLEMMLSLTSKYSQRIFEFLRMYEGRKQYEFHFDFMSLKETLSCEKYNYADFRINVLQPAQKELYEKAGISFEFHTGNKQRGIDKIYFKIITWQESAQNEVAQEIADYKAAPNANQYNGVEIILQKKYTFKTEQIKKIINDEKLREEFVKIHALIEQNLIKIKTTPTKYMAKVLGFGKTLVEQIK